MKILVACEESQRVANAFREKGHEAYSCDTQECSGEHPEYHIVGDVIPLLNGNCTFTTQSGQDVTIEGRWDMIIGFPPCTYMTNGGAVRMFWEKSTYDRAVIHTERLKKMILARDFFMAIYNADCDKIAIENPTPMGIAMLPDVTQVIQPWMFGEPWSKRTCLWLKGLPELESTNVVTEGIQPWVNGGSKDANGKYRQYKGRGERNPKNRSKTFYGVAEAMANQWS